VTRMTRSRSEVVGVGYATWDEVCVVDDPPAPGGKARVREYFQQPGGQVPTALVALQRWGVGTAFLGPIGDDEGGRLQQSSLRAEGVEILGRVCRGVASQRSFISVDATSGERTIQWFRHADLAIGTRGVDLSVVAGARAVLLDGEEIELALEVARVARDGGARVMIDVDEPRPGTAELLAMTDVAIISGDLVQRLTGENGLGAALRELCRCGPAVAVATLGAQGVVVWRDGALSRRASYPVDVVDTTSAGDVFHAGYLYGEIRGWTADETLTFATAAAGLTCGTLGGRSAIPSVAAVSALVADETTD